MLYRLRKNTVADISEVEAVSVFRNAMMGGKLANPDYAEVLSFEAQELSVIVEKIKEKRQSS